MVIKMSILLIWLKIQMTAAHSSGSVTPALPSSSSPPATTVQTGVTSPAHSNHPAVIAARIGLAGVIICALIAVAFALNQLRRNPQLEQRSQEEKIRHE